MNKVGIVKTLRGLYVDRAGRSMLIMAKVLPVLLILSSCYTAKQVNYLQDVQGEMIVNLRPSTYAVQPNDVLNIQVQSRDPDQTVFFNSTAAANRNLQANPASFFLTGYTVNTEGLINLAIVGKLKVSDMTVEEIAKLVQTEIDKYLLNAIVSVKLTSFKISVIGDVRNPGTNYIYNAQATVFEALAAAGDMNFSAKRKDVKLVRQEGNVSRVVNLDLTSPAIINSPYYFLHPNDVIYVETSKPNLANSNLGIPTLLLTAISTTVLILNFTRNN